MINFFSFLPIFIFIPLIFSNTNFQIAENLVFPDQTIRPFGDSYDSAGFCAFKRYADYVKDQEVWMWPCADAFHANSKKAGKYWWKFNSETGLIQSEGSFAMRPHEQ